MSYEGNEEIFWWRVDCQSLSSLAFSKMSFLKWSLCIHYVWFLLFRAWSKGRNFHSQVHFHNLRLWWIWGRDAIRPQRYIACVLWNKNGKLKNLPKSSSFCSVFFQNDYKLGNKSERVGMLRSSPYQQITAGLSCHYRFFNIPVCMYCIAFHLSAVCLQLTYKTSFRGKGLFWPCCHVVAAHRWRHICKRSKNHSILILWQMINSAYL